MQRRTLDSSHLAAVGYDSANRLLEVEFATGQIYHFFEVPEQLYEGLTTAPSAGQYFYAYINKQFRYRELTDTSPTSSVLAFASGNPRKFRYMQEACRAAGIDVEQLRLNVDEIQSDDPEKITIAKVQEAFRLSRRPVVVNDLFWNIVALRGLPGAYAKEVQDWLTPEDWLALLANKKDRTVTTTETLAYYDGRVQKVFSQVQWGEIVTKPRGKGKSLMQLVHLQGLDGTIAEVESRGEQAYAPGQTVWQEFVGWYKIQKRLGRV